MVSCPRYAEEYLTCLAWLAGWDGYDVCIILTLAQYMPALQPNQSYGRIYTAPLFSDQRKPVELH